VTEGDVKIEGSLSERFRQTPIMRVEEVVVQLEAYSQHRIYSFVVSDSNFEQSLAKVAAEVQGWPHMARSWVFSTVVQILAKLPACFPRLLLHVALASKIEDPLAMNVREVG
jgi:hypothetical protein